MITIFDNFPLFCLPLPTFSVIITNISKQPGNYVKREEFGILPLQRAFILRACSSALLARLPFVNKCEINHTCSKGKIIWNQAPILIR